MDSDSTQLQQAQLAAILGPDPSSFETLVSHLMSSANEQRSQAEVLFNLCKQNHPDALALKLAQLLQSSPHVEIRAMSAILLRKQLTRDDTYIWPRLSATTQTALKSHLLVCVQREDAKTITKKLCDTVSELASGILPDGGWPELLSFMFQCVTSDSPRLQESALLMFAQLSQYIGETLIPHLTTLHSVFLQCLSTSSNPDVRIASLGASINFIQCLSGASDRDKFQDLLPSMMQTLTEALNSGQESIAQEALKLLIELAGTEPKFLRRQLVDVVGSMLQIAEAESLEEGTRHLAIEFVITLAEARERAPGMMRKLPQFISRLFAILMKMLLDIEDDPKWHTADTEDEDAGETSNYSVGQECLDRLSISLGGNTIVPVASEVLPLYLAAPEWKKHHAALIALAQIAEGCSKVSIYFSLMDLASNYEIKRTAQFIYDKSFTKVALQDSTRVTGALRDDLLCLIKESDSKDDERSVPELFVMADTTYGSCCVDEVGASHVEADCVVHYGHTCLSPTSTLPALFIFGKSLISESDCARSLSNCLSTGDKSVLVLYGLEYAHAIHHLRKSVVVPSNLCGSKSNLPFYANVIRSVMNPSEDNKSINEENGSVVAGNRYSIGGLTWELPEGHRMENYMIFWIGSDNAAFANVVLTFNSSEIVRYDPIKNELVKDSSQQNQILRRRYYLVEKAKDANIVGILVGTLGVAGYRRMIDQMKDIITLAGKKAYTLVMGKSNPAKLANFPECDVFVYVSCAQTALLDSKDFFAPVITPFEAILAFTRGSEWNGSYVLEFRDLMDSSSIEVGNKNSLGEARFSFLQGGYVEDVVNEAVEDGSEDSLVELTQKALQVREKNSGVIVKGTATSGAEFLSGRTYQGLEMQSEDPLPREFVVGRTGKASGYEDEKN